MKQSSVASHFPIHSLSSFAQIPLPKKLGNGLTSRDSLKAGSLDAFLANRFASFPSFTLSYGLLYFLESAEAYSHMSLDLEARFAAI